MKKQQGSVALLRDYFTRRITYPRYQSQENEYLHEAKARALQLFHEAAVRVPAYNAFLKNNGIRPDSIKTFHDFSAIPITTKENYIEKYGAWERSWDGKPDKMHMISTSSGTTGASQYWPRGLRHDIDGAVVHEFFLHEIFHVDKTRTLFVNGFAMGNWIAGTFTLGSTSLVAWKGYPLTIMTPGYDKDAIVRVVHDVSPYFMQTIITGHTPFLKEIVKELNDIRNLKKRNIRLLGTGQGITEEWRSYVTNHIRSVDVYRTFLNLYGSADASLMGFESPVSIAARRQIDASSSQKEIFGDARLPSLYQYDPQRTYFEEVKGELHITKDSGCPLVRYNIHDTGGVFGYDDLIARVRGRTVLTQQKNFPWRFPFVYLFGRDRFMVKIYGANIYTEHIQHALDHPKLQRYITGRFIASTSYDAVNNPILYLRIELSPKTKKSHSLEILIESIFLREVSRLNSEYRFIVASMGKKANPTVVLYEHGYPKYFPLGKVKKTS